MKPPPGNRCKFCIRILLDPGKCWFLLPWAGCRSYNHPKQLSGEKRRRMDTCTDEDRNNFAIYAQQGSAGVAAGIAREQSGNHFSRTQMRHNKMRSEMQTGQVPPPAPGPDDLHGHESSAEQVIRFLEKEKDEGKKSYIALLHTVESTSLQTIYKGKKDKGKGQKKKCVLWPTADSEELKESDSNDSEEQKESDSNDQKEQKESDSNDQGLVVEVESSDAAGSKNTTSITLSSDEELQVREMLKPIRDRLRVGQKIMLAIVWVRADERRLFELYPEVLMLDITFGTNSEGRPLAATACFDSYLKTFTPIRAFLPSECQWVFQWIWSTAIPSLLGEDNISRIQLVLPYGDSKIYNAFNNVQARLYVSAIHGLRIFHLLTQPLGKLNIQNRVDNNVKAMVKT
jgi:hypothetical protein